MKKILLTLTSVSLLNACATHLNNEVPNFVAKNGIPAVIEVFDDKNILIYEYSTTVLIKDRKPHIQHCGIEYIAINNIITNPLNKQKSCREFNMQANKQLKEFTLRTTKGIEIINRLEKSLKNK